MAKDSREGVPAEAREALGAFRILVEATTGLHFGDHRDIDLWRAVRNLARDRREPDAVALLRKLGEGPLSEATVEDLAPHLTVGETYFFREMRTLEAFRDRGLPEMRAYGDGPVRIWCAGCSSGEEPYTVAMLLDGGLPGGGFRDVRILGTDLNPRALAKARQGEYSRWSFRGFPEAWRERYFDPGLRGHARVKPRFRERVAFARHNLVADGTPWEDDPLPTVAVFCRNVLIYIAPAAARDILHRFYRLLAPGGWLLVAPCETALLAGTPFVPVPSPGATLYRKPPNEEGTEVGPAEWGWGMPPGEEDSEADAREDAAWGREGSVPEWDAPGAEERERAVAAPWGTPGGDDGDGVSPPCLVSPPERDLVRWARELADRGARDEALEACERAVAADRTNPRAFYLLAQIRQERKELQEAREALRNALFLDPDFVAAHYALGTLAFREGKPHEAKRHFRNAAALVDRMEDDAPVPETEGFTARSLREALRTMGHAL